MKLFLSLFFILFTTNVFAAIKLININGASSYDIIASSSTSSDELAPIIYGGLAGSDCSSGSDKINTCDSCAGITSSGGNYSCNKHRIFGSLELTIFLSSDTKFGQPMISTADADNITVTPQDNSTSTSTGTQVYMTFFWDDICNAMAEVNCDSITGTVYKTLRVGIDADNDAVFTSADDYTNVKFIISKPTVDSFSKSDTSSVTGVNSLIVFPGDQKVYIEQLGVPTSFPRVDSAVGIFKYSTLRIMYGADANSALPSNKYKDLQLLDNGTDVSPDLVDGLTNGQTYHFRYGSVDDAGNLSNVSDFTETAEPSKTAGLLAEDINCFIATAAFGSTLDQRIESLRTFRNQYLLNSSFGRRFVKFYYNYSPRLAEKIYQSKTLKLLAQAFVWPAVIWVEAGMKYGFLIVNLLILLALALPMILIIQRRQKC